MPKKKQKPGPEAETLNIEGDWREAVKKATVIERPADGWPDPDNRQKRRKRSTAKPRGRQK